MIWILGAIAAVAAAYQLLAIFACWKHLTKREIQSACPPVSILKPVRGRQAGLDEAIQSHLRQDYPEFELLLGYRDPADRVRVGGVRQFVCERDAPNRKVGVLRDLIEHARYPVIIVNDADIVAPAGYLDAVTAPLSDPTVGLVTCLYRAAGDTWPSRFEALGVATDFAPSALVAPLTGVSEFGFGSTLAFRRADLDAIGGFAAIADYLADDYQLGAKIHGLGRRNLISKVVVETRLHEETWTEVWKHQLRWARTIRMSRPDGYAGLPVTFASLWALGLIFYGYWQLGLALLGLRLAMAIAAGWFVLRSRDVLTFFWLIPIRDLFGAAIWIAGLFGDSVEWGGRRLKLDRQGRIRDSY